MLKEVEIIKTHLEEGRDMWTEQLKKIEVVMKDQERAKQKLESMYQKRLSDIDRELDDILHLHRQKLDKPLNLGQILPGLFSKDELEDEKLIALGEISVRKNQEIEIQKLTENSEKWEIESEESEITADKLELKGTHKIVYERIAELRLKVHRYRDEDSFLTSSDETLDSLPSDLKSVSTTSLESSCKTSAASEAEYCKTLPKAKQVSIVSSKLLKFAGVVFGGNGSFKYRSGLTKQLESDKLSISERESIVYDLIHEEASIKKHDVNRTEVVETEKIEEE